MANKPLKGMSMERVSVEDLENQMSKIVNESILFFSRVSLQILSRSSLHFMGIRIFIVGYVKNVKRLFFFKTGCSSDSLMTGMSHEITD